MDFELEELLIEEPVFDFLNKEKQSDFPITNYLRKFEKELTKAEEIIEKLHRSLLDFLINEGIVLNFPEFTNILILQILRNKNVYLGDIPLNAYKIILADALDLKVLIKSFEDTIKHLKNFGSENDTLNVFSMLYGHFLQMPRDIHLYNVFKKLRKSQPKTEISIYVEMLHFDSFHKYFNMVKGKNEEKLDENQNQSFPEEYLEKIAILNILFEMKSDKILDEKMGEFLKKRMKMTDFERIYQEKIAKFKELKKNLLH